MMKASRAVDDTEDSSGHEQPSRIIQFSVEDNHTKVKEDNVIDNDVTVEKKMMDAPGYAAGSLKMESIDLEEEGGEATTRAADKTVGDEDEEQCSTSVIAKETALAPKQQQQQQRRTCPCITPCFFMNRVARCNSCFLFLIFILLLLFAILMIGAAMEKKTYSVAESTIDLYTQENSVCVRNIQNGTIQSFPSAKEALSLNNTTTTANTNNSTTTIDIVHCGECSECSNDDDLEILAATRNTLTGIATQCAFKNFLGRSHVYNCLEDNVGFTPGCNDCWVDNIQCTFTHCKFTCLKYKMFGQGNNKRHGSTGEVQLNDCLQCDEVMCGEAFLNCAGANRRRMGIVSDIGRDANREQCMDVTLDWAALIPAD